MNNDLVSFGLLINNFENFSFEKFVNINSVIKKNHNNYEILILINSSQDENFEKLLLAMKGLELENILMFSTFTKLNRISAEWCILSNSLGDKVILLNENIKNIENILSELELASLSEITLFKSDKKKKMSFSYKLFRFFFKKLARSVFGKSIKSYEYPAFIISRNMINVLSNASNPPSALQKEIVLNSKKSSIKKIDINLESKKKKVKDIFFEPISFFLENSFKPIRVASLLALVVSFFSFCYTLWVLFVFLTKDFIEGWVSTNLIISVFFFLFSIILFLISEYFIVLFKRSELNTNIKNEYTKRSYIEKFDINIKNIND